jgi:hypothetical protein
MTGNATTAIIAAKVRVRPAMKNITAVIVVRVMTITNCVMTAEIALRIIANVRKNAVDVMKWAKPSAQTAAKNAPAVTGFVMNAASVPTVSETRRTAPTAISVSSVQIGYVIAEKAAADVLSDVLTVMRFAAAAAVMMPSATIAGTVLTVSAERVIIARSAACASIASSGSVTAETDAQSVRLSVRNAMSNAKTVLTGSAVPAGFVTTVSAVRAITVITATSVNIA